MKRIPGKVSPVAVLGVAHRVKTTFASKARITWCFPCLHSAEERLESKLYSFGNVLKHLAVYTFQSRSVFFQHRYAGLRFKPAGITLFLFPRILSVSKRIVQQPTTLVKH